MSSTCIVGGLRTPWPVSSAWRGAAVIPVSVVSASAASAAAAAPAAASAILLTLRASIIIVPVPPLWRTGAASAAPAAAKAPAAAAASALPPPTAAAPLPLLVGGDRGRRPAAGAGRGAAGLSVREDAAAEQAGAPAPMHTARREGAGDRGKD